MKRERNKRSKIALAALAVAAAWSCGALELRLGAKGAVDVMDGAEKIATYSGLNLAYDAKHNFFEGEATVVPGGWEVKYKTPSTFPEGADAPDVRGRFTCEGGKVRVRFTVAGTKRGDGFRGGLCMFNRRHADGLKCGGLTKGGTYWVRDPDGGQPWEEPLRSAIAYTNAAGRGVAYIFTGRKSAPHAEWKSPWAQHLVFRKANGHDGGGYSGGDWESEFEVEAVSPDAPSPLTEAAALAAAGRPAKVTLRTERTYNWFDGTEKEIEVFGEVANAQTGRRVFDVSWRVRGFNGETFAVGARRIALDAGAAETVRVAFDPKERRGIYFVEVSAKDAADGREAFARTNVARLPPHKFKATPENSPFGIAAYWPIPDEESVQTLMDRMGVMWVRNGDTRLQHPPRVANRQTGGKKILELQGGEREKWILDQLETCRTNRNVCWEFSNELNMEGTGGIALATKGIGKAVLAPAYAEFAKDLRRLRDERGYDVKLLALGLAGYDRAFLAKIHELGAWDCFDGYCLHPGRGNFTVDFPYAEPERAGSADAAPPTGDNYWNYLASVRGMQRQMREYGGEKPLWLTEVYTPGFPNSWWEDSIRSCAENTLMTYAFIKADGVKCGMYYQLFDTVWYDKLGVDPKEREYFFGLLNRDLSFKPSLMAYCAAAEALDGAEFAGWARTGRATTHAMVFRTPRGAMAVAWDRSDGMILNADHGKGKRYASPEPWDDRWKTAVEEEFALDGKFLERGGAVVVNAIGQRRVVAAEGGKARIRLTGAPAVVYGLDLAKTPLW